MNSEPGYRPYCLMCSTMGRMTITPQGFRCDGEGDTFGRPGCKNEIDKEGKRLPGSAGPDPDALAIQRVIMNSPVSFAALLGIVRV